MPCCCVPNCTNRSEKGFRMFKFPQGDRNAERIQEWARNIGGVDLNKRNSVCQVHFAPDQFEANRADGKRLLRWNAVPTIFFHNKGDEARKTPKLSCFEWVEVCMGPEEIIKQKESQESAEIITQKQLEDSINRQNPEERELQRNLIIKSTEIIKREEFEESVDGHTTPKERELQRKLTAAHNKINCLQKKLRNLEYHFETLFSEDQVKFLKGGSLRGFTWSDATLYKGMKLYTACGPDGYDEILKQNLPYPCVRTLQRRKQILKMDTEI